MNRAELISTIASQMDGVTKKDVELFEKIYAEVVTSKMATEPVKTSLGTFTVTERAARKGRNPQTGSEIFIDAMKTPRFKPTKALKEVIKNA